MRLEILIGSFFTFYYATDLPLQIYLYISAYYINYNATKVY